MKKNIFRVLIFGILFMITGCSTSVPEDILPPTDFISLNSPQPASSPQITLERTIIPSITPAPVNPYKGWIAFGSFREESKGRSDLFLVSPEGGDIIKMELSLFDPGWPSWSPDGNTLAFQGRTDGQNDIYTVDVACAHLNNGCQESANNLTSDGNSYYQVSWSPDGTRFVYSILERRNPPEVNLTQIGVINVDGSGKKIFTSKGGEQPVWSSDGSRIAFTSRRLVTEGEQEGHIFIMNADGTDITPFLPPTETLRDSILPAWSPDGQTIAFVSSEGHPMEGTYVRSIYLVDADGSNIRLLVRDGSDPSWSSDGKRIVFERDTSIYIINLDGSGLIQITDSLVPDFFPVWGP